MSSECIEFDDMKSASLRPQYAVLLKNVSFYYPKHSSDAPAYGLLNVTIKIPTGTIYGLLGPSGCGKTSTLRCIVGQIKPHSGYIKIFGVPPDSKHSIVPGPGVGYMPQEIALYNEFTVGECLQYFGKITGLTKKERKSRIAFLSKFLELNFLNRLVANLSGGQKRRVSLAAALIHKPPLLILDEPTVGVDPLLRESIWSHLVEITQKEKTTVLITTHYIEEARQANVIGLMREGSILTESNPDSLLKQNELDSLELVFLKICRHQGCLGNNVTKRESIPCLTDVPINGNSVMFDHHKRNIRNRSGFRQKIQTLGALIEKNTTRLKRNLPLLIFQSALPAIQLILFCLCIGQDPKHLDVSLYNPDISANYSYQFLNSIDTEYVHFISVNSQEEAINLVKEGETFGALVISPNFTTSITNRFTFEKLFSVELTNETIKDSTMKLYLDGSEFPILVSLMREFMEKSANFLAEIASKLLAVVPPSYFKHILEAVDPPVYGQLIPNFRDYMAPGLIIGISYILAVGLTSLSFVLERKEGLLERSFVSGVAVYQVLLAHVFVQVAIIFVQSVLLLICVFAFFNIFNQGSVILVFVITVLQGIAGMSFGFLISSFCQSEQTCILLAVGVFYPNLIQSGIIWPLEAMPSFMRYMSYLFPQTLAVKSMRYVIGKGWGLDSWKVWLGILTSGGWIIIFNVLAILIFSYKKF